MTSETRKQVKNSHQGTLCKAGKAGHRAATLGIVISTEKLGSGMFGKSQLLESSKETGVHSNALSRGKGVLSTMKKKSCEANPEFVRYYKGDPR